jgi:hypothetical protein
VGKTAAPELSPQKGSKHKKIKKKMSQFSNSKAEPSVDHTSV